jgi:ribosome-associated heat shock protein Hsp15
MKPVRLDKWLWAVRLFKTRTQAADGCRLARVTVNGRESKASREVRLGDTIRVRLPDLTRTVRVTGLLDRRIGAALVAEFFEDLTPPDEWDRARRAREEHRLLPPPFPQGSGRPSSQQRRLIEKFLRSEAAGIESNPDEDGVSSE